MVALAIGELEKTWSRVPSADPRANAMTVAVKTVASDSMPLPMPALVNAPAESGVATFEVRGQKFRVPPAAPNGPLGPQLHMALS